MSLSVLWSVWGDRSGYVFVPRARHTPGRKKSDAWDEGPAFSWPEDKEAIASRIDLSDSEGWDVYWCPLVFAKPRRTKESARDKQGWLYSDLDTADPTAVEPAPSIVIQSSEGRWQAYWKLGHDISTVEVEALSRSIAYRYASAGADKSGWDVTQVLRVPGTMNHKYDPPFKVGIMWARATPHEPTAFPTDTTGTIAEASLDDLLTPYKLSKRTKELLFAKVAVGDRSERLWELAKLLIEAEVPVATCIKALKLCLWNKYKGRADEDHRLLTDVLKAEAEYRKTKAEGVLEIKPLVETEAREWPIHYDKFLSKRMAPPQWWVEGIWSSYGMIAGEPKTYKSFLAGDLALSVASGRPFLGVFPVHTQGAVLYIQEENPESDVQKRTKLVAQHKGLLTSEDDSIPPSLPIYFSNNIGFDLTNEGHRAELESAVSRLKIVLLILDPLYMMLGEADENNSKEMRPILKFLKELRDKYECGTLIVHHFRKQQQGGGRVRGGQRARGSSIFHGWVESALYTELLADCIRVEREFRSFPKQPDLKIVIGLGDHGEYTPEVLTDEGGTTAADIKKEELITLLADKRDGMGFEELRSALKAPRPRVQQWVRELKDEGFVDTKKVGRGTVYVLTDKGKDEREALAEEDSV